MRIGKTNLAALLPGAEPAKPHWSAQPLPGVPKPVPNATVSSEPGPAKTKPESHGLLSLIEDEKDMAGVLTAPASVPWPGESKPWEGIADPSPAGATPGAAPVTAAPGYAGSPKKGGKRPELAAWGINALWVSLLLVAAASLMFLRIKFQYENQAAALVVSLGVCVAHLTLFTLCLSKVMDGRNWARILMVAGVAGVTAWLLAQLFLHRPDCFHSTGMGVATTMAMFAQCLQIGAVVLLFMPESNAWFARLKTMRTRRAQR